MALIKASEDPVAGIYQTSDAFRSTLLKAFYALDPTCTAEVAYGSCEKQPSRSHFSQTYADCSNFHTAYRQVRESKPTGGCSEANIISMAISIHTGKATKLDYAHRDIPHKTWINCGTWKVLKSNPKWQGIVPGKTGGACIGNKKAGGSHSDSGVTNEHRTTDEDHKIMKGSSATVFL
jgi:hypothetical protein